MSNENAVVRQRASAEDASRGVFSDSRAGREGMGREAVFWTMGVTER